MQNAFTEWLSQLGFNIHPTLVVDILHEFELGVFKSILKHLLRLIYTVDPNHINMLNKR